MGGQLPLYALAMLMPLAAAQGNCPDFEIRPPGFSGIPCSTFRSLGLCNSNILTNPNAPDPPGSYCASTCGRCPEFRIQIIQITRISFSTSLSGFTEATFTSEQKFSYRQSIANNVGVDVSFVSITSISVSTSSVSPSRQLLQNGGLNVQTSIDVPEGTDTQPQDVVQQIEEQPESVLQGSDFEDAAQVDPNSVETEQIEEEVQVAPNEDPEEALERERGGDGPPPGPAPSPQAQDELPDELSEELTGNVLQVQAHEQAFE